MGGFEVRPPFSQWGLLERFFFSNFFHENYQPPEMEPTAGMLRILGILQHLSNKSHLCGD